MPRRKTILKGNPNKVPKILKLDNKVNNYCQRNSIGHIIRGFIKGKVIKYLI